jgi:hypothetical protein
MKRFFALDHPFYRPVWVRAGLVALCAGWTFVEVSMGNTLWAALFAGLAGYLFWALFIAWSPPPADGGE